MLQNFESTWYAIDEVGLGQRPTFISDTLFFLGIDTSTLMNDSIFRKVVTLDGIELFFTITCVRGFECLSKMCLNHSVEYFEYFTCVRFVVKEVNPSDPCVIINKDHKKKKFSLEGLTGEGLQISL